MVSSAFRPRAAYRNFSRGEMIADGAVHALALVAGIIGFSAGHPGQPLRKGVIPGGGFRVPDIPLAIRDGNDGVDP